MTQKRLGCSCQEFLENRSLSAKRITIVIGMSIVLVGVLMIGYRQNQKQSVIEADVHAARNLILMAESLRENMAKKWDLGIFPTELLNNFESANEKERKAKIRATISAVAARESARAKAREGCHGTPTLTQRKETGI